MPLWISQREKENFPFPEGRGSNIDEEHFVVCDLF